MAEKFDRYYTPEQLEKIRAQGEKVGADRIREVEQAEWPNLMAAVKAEMDKGTDPADPKVRALARRWLGLVREFTAGDPGIERSLGNMWRQEEAIQGIDTAHMRAMMAYIAKASEAEGGSD